VNRFYTCIIIDDEAIDRMAIETELDNFEHIHCLGSFENGMDALQAYHQLKPDIVFVDIDMPDISGLDLIKTINSGNSANIIVSSHPEYALQGFELKVFDYILKPVETERLAECIKRLESFFALREKAHAYDVAFGQEQIAFKEGHRMIRISVDKIMYLEAYGDYTKIVTDEKTYLSLTTLSSFLESLPQGRFLRIHRSYVIAISKVQCFNFRNIDIGNSQLPVSRTYLKETRLALKPD